MIDKDIKTEEDEIIEEGDEASTEETEVLNPEETAFRTDLDVLQSETEPPTPHKFGINIIGYVLIALLGVCIVALVIYLNIFLSSSTTLYDDGFTVNLSVSDTDETEILEGDDNVITPDQIELEFTFKDLQDYEIWSNPVSKMPSIGDAKILVLPIIIPGYPLTSAQQSQTQQDIYNVFFGDASDTYWESVSSFYYESSFGQLNITGDVMTWYDASLAGLSNANMLGSQISVMQLITSALNYHVSQGNVNVDDYDVDKDGFIDGLWVIYSAPSDTSSDVYWAYTGWWSNEDNRNPNAQSDYSVYAWASLDMIYYGDEDDYRSSSYKLDSHTLVHETGHILGLNDYYDYNTDTSSISAPAGINDMMDFNVCDHNMYSKMVLGWVKPYIVIGDASIALASNQVQNSLIVVLDNSSPALKSNRDGTYTFNPFYEYILVEYYVPEGLNELDSTDAYTNGAYGIDGEGFKVYHIDNRLFVLNYYTYTLSEYTGQSYSYLYYFMSNTTGGNYGETAAVEDYGFRFIDGTTINDYFAEVSLISSNTNKSYNYERAFAYYSSGKLEYKPATTNDLFTSGQVFNVATYSKYFVYGSSNQFNNGHAFNSNIVFE